MKILKLLKFLLLKIEILKSTISKLDKLAIEKQLYKIFLLLKETSPSMIVIYLPLAILTPSLLDFIFPLLF